jgi:hypothetical protein
LLLDATSVVVVVAKVVSEWNGDGGGKIRQGTISRCDATGSRGGERRCVVAVADGTTAMTRSGDATPIEATKRKRGRGEGGRRSGWRALWTAEQSKAHHRSQATDDEQQQQATGPQGPGTDRKYDIGE